MKPFTHILVATDFEKASQRALEVAIEIARKFDAPLTLLHVYDIPTYSYYAGPWPTELAASVEKAARATLSESLAAAQKALPTVDSVLCLGDISQQILAQISRTGANLLVIGTHGRRGLSHAILGSVAEKMVRMSPVPVLTVQAPEA